MRGLRKMPFSRNNSVDKEQRKIVKEEARKEKEAKRRKEKVFNVSSHLVHIGSGVAVSTATILKDEETGVQYIYVIHSSGISVIPRLGSDGKPIIDPVD